LLLHPLLAHPNLAQVELAIGEWLD